MLLSVSGVEKAFGAEILLSDVCFRLAWQQKVGLVGRNGTGKTTLLRIIAGQVEQDRGAVRFTRGVRSGYLRQVQVVEHGLTVRQEAEDAFAPVLEMERRLRDLEAQMAAAHGQALESVLEEYGLLHDRFDAMGGYESLRDIPQVLRRLGFSEADLDKPTSRLSGGEKTRLALAKLLLSGPDVLLLDEPTNHLDLDATEWLEGFLHDFGGAVLLVSHDRVFLDRVVTAVAELESGRLTTYHGDFTAYWRQKQERLERQAVVYDREQREIARLTEFYEKWKNTPTKRSQAFMRLRWAERIRAGATERPAGPERSMKAAFRASTRSGDETLIVDNLCKRYGERTLFAGLSFLLRRGDRLGVVGPNGAGKSTFLSIVLGRDRPTEGSTRFGANVAVGSFVQEASDLDLEASVIENMMGVAEMRPEEARTYLGRFLFSGDDVFRPVSTLSGGEKNKLALAQLTYLKPNLLILDEPTNHLDLDSRDALTSMLRRYDGTIVLVSHDRYLLDAVTTSTLEIADGKAMLYDGPYSAYRQARAGHAAGQAQPAPRRATEGNPATAGMNSHQLSRERRRAAKSVGLSEKRVAEAEDWVRRIEEALSAPMPGDDMVRLSHDYERSQAELAEAMAEWERVIGYAQQIGATV
ncbi:MAG TPA: ABC-F family ATP-binding cassette domain-containing protein [Chthonomonadales bacterium]|nr:ABC-F family ATP-binding cassette domain-containing protein [Chthonomonadales bacterium]